MPRWRQALPPRIAFVGLHGGVFEVLQSFAGEARLADGLPHRRANPRRSVDLARYRLVFLQHVRGEDGEHYRPAGPVGGTADADLRVIAISAYSAQALPGLAKRRLVENDPKLSAYYGSLKDNLRRMLIYINVTYLHGREGVAAAGRRTPPHDLPPRLPAPGLFAGVDDFLAGRSSAAGTWPPAPRRW